MTSLTDIDEAIDLFRGQLDQLVVKARELTGLRGQALATAELFRLLREQHPDKVRALAAVALLQLADRAPG